MEQYNLFSWHVYFGILLSFPCTASMIFSIPWFFVLLQGLQISKKERVSPWEILEGHKNPAPLNLSWFGAVKLERKPLKYEEQHRWVIQTVYFYYYCMSVRLKTSKIARIAVFLPTGVWCHRLLLYHTHSMKKPLSYFFEPPPLPPEDLEPLPEKQVSDSRLSRSDLLELNVNWNTRIVPEQVQ